jgi:hypothetical protein
LQNNFIRYLTIKEDVMKPRTQTLIITAVLLATNVAYAIHGFPQQAESQALRKVVAANEVASLNTLSAGIPQITCDLVDAALVVLENDFGGQPGNGVNLGTYTTPSYFDNHDADADFTIPWGQQLTHFRFDVSGRASADYVIIFGRNGEQLYRENIGRLITGSLQIRIPINVNPARISVVRLHNTARRGTRITAIGSRGGFGGGNNSQAIAQLNDIKSALVNYNPDMNFVRTRLTYVERLLRQ